MLVWKLVRLHKGKINLSSVENQGSVIKVSFPKDSKRFRKAHPVSYTHLKTAQHHAHVVNEEVKEKEQPEGQKGVNQCAPTPGPGVLPACGRRGAAVNASGSCWP